MYEIDVTVNQNHYIVVTLDHAHFSSIYVSIFICFIVLLLVVVLFVGFVIMLLIYHYIKM